jgi:hypothetical protein
VKTQAVLSGKKVIYPRSSFFYRPWHSNKFNNFVEINKWQSYEAPLPLFRIGYLYAERRMLLKCVRESVKQGMMGEMDILIGSQQTDVVVVAKIMERDTEVLKGA